MLEALREPDPESRARAGRELVEREFDQVRSARRLLELFRLRPLRARRTRRRMVRSPRSGDRLLVVVAPPDVQAQPVVLIGADPLAGCDQPLREGGQAEVLILVDVVPHTRLHRVDARAHGVGGARPLDEALDRDGLEAGVVAELRAPRNRPARPADAWRRSSRCPSARWARGSWCRSSVVSTFPLTRGTVSSSPSDRSAPAVPSGSRRRCRRSRYRAGYRHRTSPGSAARARRPQA